MYLAKVQKDVSCKCKKYAKCKSNVSGGNVEMGARGRYIGRRAILSQLPHQQREREGEGGLMPHRDTRLNSNQTKPTKQTTPIWQNIYSKTKPNSTLPNQSYRTCLTREREGNHATQRYLTQTVSTISNQSYCREAGGFIPI